MQRWHNPNIISFDRSVADFHSGRDTPRKFLERCLEVIAARDKTVQAFVTLNIGAARKAADAATKATKSASRYRLSMAAQWRSRTSSPPPTCPRK